MSTFFIAAANDTDDATETQQDRGEGGTGAPDQDNDCTQFYNAERLRRIDSDRQRPIEGCSWRAVAAECHVTPGR
jgi:hypothetical protein